MWITLGLYCDISPFLVKNDSGLLRSLVSPFWRQSKEDNKTTIPGGNLSSGKSKLRDASFSSQLLHPRRVRDPNHVLPSYCCEAIKPSPIPEDRTHIFCKVDVFLSPLKTNSEERCFWMFLTGSCDIFLSMEGIFKETFSYK